MANAYYTLVTATGRALEAQAKASNTALKLTRMAVGDSLGAEYDPTGSETKLKRERWRGNLNTLSVHPDHPNWLIAEAVLPDAAGGWWIREVGLLTATGTLYAIAKYPPTYKPVLADGGNKMLYIRMIFEVTNTANVTLQVDPSVVLATRSYVDDRHQALHLSQTALAAVQVDTMHRQVVSNEQEATRDATVQQTLAELAVGQTQAAQRLRNTERRLADRQQALTAAFAAMACAQIQTMTRQIEHEHRLPVNP